MRILITAGNTQAPIDRVRCLTNIFTGRTGAGIAVCAHDRGHDVTLLTSHPEVLREMQPPQPLSGPRWRPYGYRTFDDLHALMSREVRGGGYDAVIHCAAVSDYLAGGIFAAAPGTRFLADGPELTIGVLEEQPLDPIRIVVKREFFDFDAKYKGCGTEHHFDLGVPRRVSDRCRDLAREANRVIGCRDLAREDVMLDKNDEPQLLEIAERSRRQSDADLMVANTLEGSHEWAYLGPVDGTYQRLERRALAEQLLAAVERTAREKGHG